MPFTTDFRDMTGTIEEREKKPKKEPGQAFRRKHGVNVPIGTKIVIRESPDHAMLGMTGEVISDESSPMLRLDDEREVRGGESTGIFWKRVVESEPVPTARRLFSQEATQPESAGEGRVLLRSAAVMERW